MDDQALEKKKPKEAPPTAPMLAARMEYTQAYTSFGRLILSREGTQPKYGFGTASRDQAQLNFQSEELSSTVGKFSPGPKYAVYKREDYQQDAQWSIGKDPRKTSSPPVVYDYFYTVGYADHPDTADKNRRKRPATTKFGTESKLGAPEQARSPGPQYYPPEKPVYKVTERFTFGWRRHLPGTDGLSNQISTPGIVGPGRYAPERKAKTSQHQDFPIYSMPKTDRIPRQSRPIQKNQTYDTWGSVGRQLQSRRKSAGHCHFGSSTRDQWNRIGIFKNQMATQPTRVRIPHPKF